MQVIHKHPKTSKKPGNANIPGFLPYAESGTRTRTPERTEDFKSHVSAIPPFPHVVINIIAQLGRLRNTKMRPDVRSAL